MKLLILGADGMIGHQHFLHFQEKFEVKAALRQKAAVYRAFTHLFNADNSYFEVDVRDMSRVKAVLDEFKPDLVIHAAGIVKQHPLSDDRLVSIEINALAPLRLAKLCQEVGARLITFSTDCIFSGKKGTYTEKDPADAQDVYGLTKALGEVHAKNALTLRTSTIGLELNPANHHGLIEWFLNASGNIRGFRRAIYTGVITKELCRVVEKIICHYPALHGVYQLAAAPISKYDLLKTLAQKLQRRDIEVEPYDDFVCDRSLNGELLARTIDYQAPDWDTMLSELAYEIQATRCSEEKR